MVPTACKTKYKIHNSLGEIIWAATYIKLSTPSLFSLLYALSTSANMGRYVCIHKTSVLLHLGPCFLPLASHFPRFFNSLFRYQMKWHFFSPRLDDAPGHVPVHTLLPLAYCSPSKYVLSLALLYAWEIQQWKHQTKILAFITLGVIGLSFVSSVSCSFMRAENTSVLFIIYIPAHSSEPGIP